MKVKLQKLVSFFKKITQGYIECNFELWDITFIDCDKRMYGRNCSETCGLCLGKEQCHAINGVCANGCSDGFLGTKCTEGNYSYVFTS